jgi:TP901 family phage tail tape measure protein
MMLALTKGAAATRSQRDAFKSLGLDAGQVAKDMQRDAGGTITDVMKRLQALPKEAQAGALTDLFGSESVAAIARCSPASTSCRPTSRWWATRANTPGR